jgi:hypothetical protein
MTARKRREGGYIGLVALLLGAAIIAILFAKLYLTPQKQNESMSEFQATNASGTIPTTEFGRMRANEDAARAIRENLNAQNRATDLELAP